jgi:hypothetical protein
MGNQPGVNLDHAVFPLIRVERILNITLTHDAEVPNDLLQVVSVGDEIDIAFIL